MNFWYNNVEKCCLIFNSKLQTHLLELLTILYETVEVARRFNLGGRNGGNRMFFGSINIGCYASS